MKRTYPANIDGQIFYIDEDAFLLLQNYLQKLKLTFTGAEGTEIVGDIESRIREHFDEKIRSGKNVIVLADVNTVIETMGRPEDLNPECDAEASGDECKARPLDLSVEMTDSNGKRKKLYRNMKNKVFGGVLGGLSVLLGWNANIMRLLLIVLVIATTGILHMWPFILAYLIAWMIIPPAVTPRQILQMRGAPVNVDTVGQTVMEDSGVTPPPVESAGSGLVSTFFSIIGKCIMAFIGFLGSCISFACLVGFMATLVGLIVYLSAGNLTVLSGMKLDPFIQGWYYLGAAMSALMLGTIIFGMVGWGGLSTLFCIPKMSKAWVISLVITSIILIALCVALSLFGMI
ncbi:MAG: PspC domain-containing protein [Muribaculaceae bacterium]|nr:PspC domain-containing protein [Muribaculaceae bacterium]